MCFACDALPPIAPLAGAAVDHEDVVLTSADGTELAAFVATPSESGATVGVVVLPDVRGLYRFYEELALRFAERGIPAVAIDYFGRTAGVQKRDDDFEFMPHVQKTEPAKIQEDVEAAADRLRSLGVAKVFTVGFCFGGRNSWLAASAGHDLAGAIGFYGRPGTLGPDGSSDDPIAVVSDVRVPILALMGGADDHIPVEDVRAYEDALQAAGVANEVIVYEGAPHSFFDRKQEQFSDQSDDAWARTLSFIEQYA